MWLWTGRTRKGAYIDRAGSSISTLGTLASVHGLSQCILITPAIEEVSMEPITGRVTHCVNQVLIISERRGVVVEFVEDWINGYWVRLRANSTVVVSKCWEGHLQTRLLVKYEKGRGVVDARGWSDRCCRDLPRPSKRGRMSLTEVWDMPSEAGCWNLESHFLSGIRVGWLAVRNLMRWTCWKCQQSALRLLRCNEGLIKLVYRSVGLPTTILNPAGGAVELKLVGQVVSPGA